MSSVSPFNTATHADVKILTPFNLLASEAQDYIYRRAKQKGEVDDFVGFASLATAQVIHVVMFVC